MIQEGIKIPIPFTVKNITAIEQAIVQAEKKTAGEIRVAMTVQSYAGSRFKRFLQNGKAKKAVLKKARTAFDSMEMHKTEARTGVLIFLSLNERQVVVVGDEGISKHCTPEIWKEMRDMIVKGMKEGKEVSGICRAIRMAGDILSNHFPNVGPNLNELSDKVVIMP